jgi:cytochrome c oxidase cbb3-type subunit 3
MRFPLPFLLLTVALSLQGQVTPPAGGTNSVQQQLPDAPGKDTVQRICGSCHTVSIVLGRGLTRDEWSEVVASMITRGAKGSPSEFSQVIDYLSKNLPPKQPVPAGPAVGAAAPRRTGGGGLVVGPQDKQVVDAVAADRGKTIYVAECITCHGSRARGTERGSDLVRSLVVLHDRYGSTLAPFLKKGHPTQSGRPSADFSEAQMKDLSHFLHQQVNDTLRSGPYSKVLNVLTGDPKAGAAYFNGAGRCSTCHSPTGDLAGIASKYDPPNLQQRFLFPRAPAFAGGQMTSTKPVTVTVTPKGGTPISGTLERMDDFDVALRDSSGEYHSFKRTNDLKVEKHDPYEAHIDLLDQYTDKNIHDVVAYLETLK